MHDCDAHAASGCRGFWSLWNLNRKSSNLPLEWKRGYCDSALDYEAVVLYNIYPGYCWMKLLSVKKIAIDSIATNNGIASYQVPDQYH
jgi:hypothetical protein